MKIRSNRLISHSSWLSLMVWYYAKRFYVHPKRWPFSFIAMTCTLHPRIKIQKITKCRIIISTEPQRALKAESFYHDVIEDVFGMMTFQYFITITSCYCNLWTLHKKCSAFFSTLEWEQEKNAIINVSHCLNFNLFQFTLTNQDSMIL